MTLTLFSRSIKDACAHFGAVGDDATDNYASALLVARHIANGGYVEWPRGKYRFSAFPEINGRNGGIIGEGSGGTTWPPTEKIGTCFRHAGAGDFLRLGSSAADLVLRDFIFWPVQAKTSGAEIRLANRANNNKFIRVRALCPYRFAHVEAAVFTRFEDCHVFAPAGDAAWYVSGMADNSYKNEDTMLIACSSYTPTQAGVTMEAGTISDWTPGTAVPLGRVLRTTTDLWQVVQAGTTGAIAPTQPVYPSSESRSSQQINDGTAKLVFYCHANLAGVLVDSGGDYVNIDQFCKFLQGVHAVKTQHTMGGSTTAPTRITVSKLQVDHNAGHALYFAAGTRIFVQPDTMIDSARGSPYWIGSGCDKFAIFPHYEGCDAAPVNNAGNNLSKADGAAIPQGTVLKGSLGNVRADANYGVSQLLVRKIGGVDYQWAFGINAAGGFFVQQTLPVNQTVQTWPSG